MIDFQVCIVILLISILKRVTFSKKKKRKQKLLKNLALYHESLYENESKQM